MNPIVKYVLQFIVLILLQVLVVDQISFGYASEFIVPSVYFLFVLMLPLTISNGALMFLAFSIGMMVDLKAPLVCTLPPWLF
jgi:cell shape-determining protein MreD